MVPPKVEYALTPPPGKTFAEPIEQMYHWGLENQAALDEMESHLHAARQVERNAEASPDAAHPGTAGV